MTVGSSFIASAGLRRGAVVCIVGAGGKTSLMFHLANEAKEQGYSTYVSTTTRILIPSSGQYDDLNLSGKSVADRQAEPGIYVAGRSLSEKKMRGVCQEVLSRDSQHFDMVLLEADGAANKSLKGWRATEPVIPGITTHTIGVVDISAVGHVAADDLVHRLDLFCDISGATKGERLTVQHLHNVITHRMGLFYQAKGKKIIFINKVESPEAKQNTIALLSLLSKAVVVAGSVHKNQFITNQ